jgi:hypothetical protein
MHDKIEIETKNFKAAVTGIRSIFLLAVVGFLFLLIVKI